MATSGKDTGMVGYNVQAAVDSKHHLIVAHAKRPRYPGVASIASYPLAR